MGKSDNTRVNEVSNFEDLPEDYIALLKAIYKAITKETVEKIKDFDEKEWFGRYLWEYCRPSGKEQVDNFTKKARINNTSYSACSKMPLDGTTNVAKSEKLISTVCAFKEIGLIQFLDGFVLYVDDHQKNIELLHEHKILVNRILADNQRKPLIGGNQNRELLDTKPNNLKKALENRVLNKPAPLALGIVVFISLCLCALFWFNFEGDNELFPASNPDENKAIVVNNLILQSALQHRNTVLKKVSFILQKVEQAETFCEQIPSYEDIYTDYLTSTLTDKLPLYKSKLEKSLNHYEGSIESFIQLNRETSILPFIGYFNVGTTGNVLNKDTPSSEWAKLILTEVLDIYATEGDSAFSEYIAESSYKEFKPLPWVASTLAAVKLNYKRIFVIQLVTEFTSEVYGNLQDYTHASEREIEEKRNSFFKQFVENKNEILLIQEGILSEMCFDAKKDFLNKLSQQLGVET